MEDVMFDIDFNKTHAQVVVHPQFQELVPKILEGLRSYQLENHFILLSSGTTGGDVKGYALSKDALFANARATNHHFKLTEKDVWGLSLPVYHVGGLSVLARAHLLNNKVIDLRKWNPESWIHEIKNVTITTIVPTQLYDLVKLNQKAPSSLRYLVVGGDFLSSALKEEALKLGWPVIRTFGMSEVSSQLASTENPQSDDLKIFPIHKAKTSHEGRLLVKSESLFTLQFSLGEEFKVRTAKELSDQDGFYPTSDQVTIVGLTIKHLGRMGDEVKIAGHLVNLISLKETIASYLLKKDLIGSIELSLEDDLRKGKKLVLISLPEIEALQNEIAHLIYPVKIDEVRIVKSFDRTSLGKLKRS